MIAPLWTDNDARYGKVFYHIYDSAMGDQSTAAGTVFGRAANDMKKYTSHNDDASWVLVITWTDMVPRLWYSPILDKVCAQNVLYVSMRSVV